MVPFFNKFAFSQRIFLSCNSSKREPVPPPCWEFVPAIHIERGFHSALTTGRKSRMCRWDKLTASNTPKLQRVSCIGWCHFSDGSLTRDALHHVVNERRILTNLSLSTTHKPHQYLNPDPCFHKPFQAGGSGAKGEKRKKKGSGWDKEGETFPSDVEKGEANRKAQTSQCWMYSGSQYVMERRSEERT